MIENSFGKDLDIITKIDMQIVEEPKKYVDYAEIDPFDLKYQLVYKDNEFAGIINEELMLKNAN
ncbi:MAG: hypothetical protein GY870_11700, partial [archaeon]|nr:hypothetical protein [archaeon]